MLRIIDRTFDIFYNNMSYRLISLGISLFFRRGGRHAFTKKTLD